MVGGAINNGGVVLEWAGDALAPDLGDDADGSSCWSRPGRCRQDAAA